MSEVVYVTLLATKCIKCRCLVRTATFPYLSHHLHTSWPASLLSSFSRTSRAFHDDVYTEAIREAVGSWNGSRSSRSPPSNDPDANSSKEARGYVAESELPAHSPADTVSKVEHSSLRITKKRSSKEALQLRQVFLKEQLKKCGEECKARPSTDVAFWRRTRLLWKAVALDSEMSKHEKDLTKAFEAAERFISPQTHYPFRWHENLRLLYSTDSTALSPGSDATYFDNEEVQAWVEELFRDDIRISAVRKAWRDWIRPARLQRWGRIMLWCLAHSPDKAICFLEASQQKPYPNFSTIADCLLHLNRYCKDRLSSASQQKLRSLLLKHLHPRRWPLHRISYRHLNQIMFELPVAQGRQLYRLCRIWGVPHSNNALLVFMDYFTKAGDYISALHAFWRIGRRGTQELSAKEVLPRIANLLQLDFVQKYGGQQNFRILPEILELGVVLNLPLYNIVLTNAIRARSTAVAWDIFNFMQKQGVTPDAKTYYILMKDAVKRGDVSAFENIRTAIHQDQHLRTDPYLVFETLFGLHRLYGTKASSKQIDVFSEMLFLYREVYDTEILEHLKVVSPVFSHSSRMVEKARPSSHTLRLMLLAYLDACGDVQRKVELYGQFKKLLSGQNKLNLSLATDSHIFGIFLVHFSYERETLPYCFDVLDEMLRNTNKGSIAEAGDKEGTPADTTPDSQRLHSIHIYNMLLSAFMRHGHLRGTEKIHSIMNEQGVKPDKVTYNILIRGYAEMQMISQAAETLSQLKKQVGPVDEYTINALSQIQNKDKLFREIERLDAAPADTKGDAKPTHEPQYETDLENETTNAPQEVSKSGESMGEAQPVSDAEANEDNVESVNEMNWTESLSEWKSWMNYVLATEFSSRRGRWNQMAARKGQRTAPSARLVSTTQALSESQENATKLHR